MHIILLSSNTLFTYTDFNNYTKIFQEKHEGSLILIGYMVTNGLMDLTVFFMIWFMLDEGQNYAVEDHSTGLLYPVLTNLTANIDSEPDE